MLADPSEERNNTAANSMHSPDKSRNNYISDKVVAEGRAGVSQGCRCKITICLLFIPIMAAQYRLRPSYHLTIQDARKHSLQETRREKPK